MSQKQFKLKKALKHIVELRDFQRYKFETLQKEGKKWKKEYNLYLEFDLLVNVINDHNEGSKVL